MAGKFEGLGEEGVIAEVGVGVEGEVDAEYGKVVFDSEAKFSVERAGDGAEATPEESVVNDEEVGFAFDGGLDGGFAGIYCGCDFVNLPLVFDLEAVEGVGVVGEFGDFEEAFEVGAEVRQWDHWCRCFYRKRASSANREWIALARRWRMVSFLWQWNQVCIRSFWRH